MRRCDDDEAGRVEDRKSNSWATGNAFGRLRAADRPTNSQKPVERRPWLGGAAPHPPLASGTGRSLSVQIAQMSARFSSSAALDAWRDAEVARFASTLQKHAKAAIATNAATLASVAASAPHHEPPQHHNKSSSKVGYAAPPPTALRSAAVEWMKTSGLAPPPPLSQHATAAASSSKSSSSSSKISSAPPPAAPPLPLPQLGKNPSVHALTLAARRAGAEEAARRRQRTQDLAAALRTPLRRSFFCEWRDRSRLL